MEMRMRGRPGGVGEQTQTVQDVPSLFYNVTRNTKTGVIYLKVVNAVGTPQPVRVKISGVTAVESTGQAVEMSAGRLEETNSITEPTKILPVTKKVDGLSTDFTRTFPAYSITILQLKGK
jgi:alpha-N-arabinofuranosidase